MIFGSQFDFDPSALLIPVFEWNIQKVSSRDSPSSTSLIGIQPCISGRRLLSTPSIRVKKQKLRASPQSIAAGAAGPTPLKQTGFPALYMSSIMLSFCSLQSSTLFLLKHNRCRLKLLFSLFVPPFPKAHLVLCVPF